MKDENIIFGSTEKVELPQLTNAEIRDGLFLEIEEEPEEEVETGFTWNSIIKFFLGRGS